ncbi:LPS export ABC transporter periplasmic protein LptC [Salinarimonas soli]|uniref:Lipopolysaccharide-assembly, LptC-related protein n=1 Tax=Salinarimonas soli TaxID=1638099 RepID=A0A5B2VBK0_9HYPH|nr:LPS export ABC transporter periplasmic protein LptC [Salinarimonas soli]KAA2235830.1 lipopolysaccharide-assembly, LptC-related protein [Salinarimonas soli]
MDQTLDERGVTPAAAMGRTRSRAYVKARRHSTRVRWLRRAIPLGAGIAVALVAVVTLFDPFGRLGIEGMSMSGLNLSGTKITMEQPRLTGFQKDTRPYEITASHATQDVRRPTEVELVTMRGRLTLDDKGTKAHLEAARGIFDTKNERLELRDHVVVTTDSGYKAQLRSASIDFKANSVVSRDGVRVEIPGGTIESDDLQVSDGGRRMVFEGRVRSAFNPPEERGAVRTSDAAAPSSRP